MGQQGVNDFKYPQLAGFKQNYNNVENLGFDPLSTNEFSPQINLSKRSSNQPFQENFTNRGAGGNRSSGGNRGIGGNRGNGGIRNGLANNISDRRNELSNRFADIRDQDRNRFNLQEFNRDFERNIDLTRQSNIELENQRLNQLNTQGLQMNQKPYDKSISQMLIGIKDTWFDIIDDLLSDKFYTETFTKNNRLFYIGLTIVLLVIFIYLCYMLLDTSNNYDNSNGNRIQGPVYEYYNK